MANYTPTPAAAWLRLSVDAANTNPHWDFGDDNGTDTLSGASVQLDSMNLSWSTDEDWTLVAGKMGAPFETNPVFGEWLWDGDIQPAGLAGTSAGAPEIME